ncbi:MAG: gamma-glutamyltransferase [Synechococcales cyanobacterium C42_A2020_086]|jgi:gamma-glutamyltranspeptidase/glutathione hydrolase|nr:gamma-glutamyltransferase [Synechococcales cyanobacterium C42_A2020_086]
MLSKTRGVIAAGHVKTVEAGCEMLRLGGNAFDAAVAAVMASFVAEPTLTSAAGGGFLLAHTQDNQNILFDFFTQTPQQKPNGRTIDFYPVQVDFGGVTQEFHIGLGSVAVPGTMGGLFHVHQRLGRLPWAVVSEPAIHYAKTGVAISEFQTYCMTILAPILLGSAESRAIFAPEGKLWAPGSCFTIPDLADSLSYLAAEGARGFYHGDIAQKLVKDCQAQGGYLTRADLEQYQVMERQPLMMQYRGNTLVTNPPPSSGGTLIAFALSLLEQHSLSQLAVGSREHLQLLANTMQLTNQARRDGYDARLYEPDVAERFLSPDHLRTWQQLAVNKWGSTTHLSVMDSEGNAASVTTSNGEGSSYVIPGTGMMTNNMLGEADLHPQGFHQWQENVRISSMMAPTMVLRGAQPELVLGSGGSNRIRTAILQVISNLLDFEMSVEQAVGSPRVHWEDGVFNLEPGFEQAAADRAEFPFNGKLEHWPQQNMFFGGVHAVTCNNGTLSGAGDPRRGGVVAVC